MAAEAVAVDVTVVAGAVVEALPVEMRVAAAAVAWMAAAAAAAVAMVKPMES